MSSHLIYVYQTICELNGKSYIGVRKTKCLNDGYIGCGIKCQSEATKNSQLHRAVRKYGYDNFTKHILSFYDTYEEALAEERYIVNESWVKNSNNYNSALGGKGATGIPSVNRRPVLQYNLAGDLIKIYNTISEAVKETGVSNIYNSCIGKYISCNGHVFKYEKYTETELIRYNTNILKWQRIYKNDGSFTMPSMVGRQSSLKGKIGIKPSEESKLKMSLAKLGKVRIPHSEETKIKISNSNAGKVRTSEIRKKMSDSRAKYKKPIIQFDANGIKVAEYDSIGNAARGMGFRKEVIQKVLHGKLKSHKSFTFKFKEVSAA